MSSKKFKVKDNGNPINREQPQELRTDDVTLINDKWFAI